MSATPVPKAVYSLTVDEDAGYWMLLEDGIGMAKSKSRNALRRIRDSLLAVQETGLAGMTVQKLNKVRGIVQAILPFSTTPPFVGLVIRDRNDQLDVWPVNECRVVEPDPPHPPTPWNDPAIGVIPAVELLERVLACDSMADLDKNLALDHLRKVGEDIKAFLMKREEAQPSP